MVDRTAQGLRVALFETLDELRNGDIKPSQAKATCDIAGRILDTVRMELAELKVMRASLELERAVKEPLLLGDGDVQ